MNQNLQKNKTRWLTPVGSPLKETNWDNFTLAVYNQIFNSLGLSLLFDYGIYSDGNIKKTFGSYLQKSSTSCSNNWLLSCHRLNKWKSKCFRMGWSDKNINSTQNILNIFPKSCPNRNEIKGLKTTLDLFFLSIEISICSIFRCDEIWDDSRKVYDVENRC